MKTCVPLALLPAVMLLAAALPALASLPSSSAFRPPFDLRPDVHSSAPLLYASDFLSGNVYVFPQAGKNQHSIASLTGLTPTIGLAVDKRRHLFVSQQGGVLEFAEGGSQPIRTFADTGHDPGGVAICPNGTLYVANSEGVTISVYAKGATNPTGLLQADGQVFHLACDAASDVFVTEAGGSAKRDESSGWGQVDEFLANGSGPIDLPIMLGFPEGIAIDRAGDVVVADAFNNVLAFYHVGDSTPFRTLAVPGSPIELAFTDNDRAVWVTAHYEIERYAVATGRLTDSITTLPDAGGLAVSPSD